MIRSSLIAATLAALATVPASATIIIYDTPGAVQPAENVLFQGTTSGNSVTAFTNQTHTSVSFLGNENLATPAKGQARITGTDGNLDSLQFGLTDTTTAFTQVEFNIFGTHRTATSATLNFTDQFGTVFNQTFDLVNGQNFFSANAIDDQLITKVTIALNGGSVSDIRQFRIGGFGSILGGGGSGSDVPEPATWGLMLAGFAMVGFSARRRRSMQVAS